MKRTACILVVLLSFANHAHAWDLFRSQSSAIERGNAHLDKKENKEALEAYEQAAHELPNDPSVQLDRGLALLALGKLGEAREAFRRAGVANAPKEVRGPALYDLGLAFMQEADAAGKAEDLDGAHKMLEESVDALRGSLRAQPGNKDAAWNLEIAKRRLVDVEKKQEEKKKQEDEQKKEEDKDKKDQDEQDPNNDKDKEKQQKPDAGSPDRGDAGTPNQDDGQGEPDAGGQQQPEPAQADGGQEAQPQEPPPAEPQKQEPNALPEHMERALDALEAGEENLEKQRAKQRARTRPRRIEKDW